MSTLAYLLDHLFRMPNTIFVIGGLIAIIAIIAIVFGAATKIIVGRSREQTKREIAAYVAEGSIDPDKAVAMLNAGESVPHQKA